MILLFLFVVSWRLTRQFNNPDQKHDIFKWKVNKQLVNVTKVTIYIYCSGYKGILQTLDLLFFFYYYYC